MQERGLETYLPNYTRLGGGAYPSLRARPLKLCQFLPALTARFLIFLDRVDDVIFVQAGEE